MQSLKLKIKHCDNLQFIEDKQKNYSFAFREAYKKINFFNKNEIINLLKEKYNLNDIESRSLFSSVTTKFNQTKTSKEKAEIRIVEITNTLNKLEKQKNKTKKERRTIHKLKQKLKFLNENLSKDVVFGGKYNLKKISYLSNFKSQNINLKNNKVLNVNESLSEYLVKYKNDRILPIYLLGEANQTGNRFFKFDLKNNKIIYKPEKGIKINIEFSNYRNYAKLLHKLQELTENKTISITVQLSNEYIVLSFDESIVSGYCINEVERRNDVDLIKKKCLEKHKEIELIKKIYVKHYKDLDERKLKNKLSYRYFAVDLNPNDIGCSIIDKDKTKKEGYKIVKTFYYDLSELNEKLPKDSSFKERKKHTNKRKHGITHIWKDIFNTLSHYKCGHFALEDLNFSIKEEKDKPKEANRQIYNMWHRDLTLNLIDKYCNTRGIIKEEVSGAYTSTIGNLLHSYVDCVNSSIEIGRRAIFKCIKGGFYPELTDTVIHAMSSLNKKFQMRDVGFFEICDSWVKLHGYLKESGLRYRWSLSDLRLKNKHIRFDFSNKLKYNKIDKLAFA